jgi:hypothetical protein
MRFLPQVGAFLLDITFTIQINLRAFNNTLQFEFNYKLA